MTYRSVKSGWYDDPTVWDQGTVPGQHDWVVISTGHRVVLRTDVLKTRTAQGQGYDLVVESGGEFYIAAGAVLSIQPDLLGCPYEMVISGTLRIAGRIHVIRNGGQEARWWLRDFSTGQIVFENAVAAIRTVGIGTSTLRWTSAVVSQRLKEWPMNFKALESLTATGSDQAVEVPRGATLIVRPLAASVEVRDVLGSTAKLTIPADSLVMLGPSYGQTVYLRAASGTVIELGLT